MKYSCDIVRDLIPLYIDDVASRASRQMVEEHLAECADCRVLLGQMKSEEVEKVITDEKEDVIAGQRRFFKHRSAVVGSVIAGIFMIPVLICLIVNLASGSGLGWFFIVLSALLVAGSLSIVPLMVPENKGLWTLGCFTVSLLLLFGVCCLYSGGRWFFVAGTAVLFGLSVIFLPFVVESKVLSDYLEDRKGLAVMATDTVLFAAMMLTIGLHTKAPGFFGIASSISVPIVLLAWALFFIIRNAKKIRMRQDSPARLEEGFTEKAAAAEQDSIEKIVSKAQSENPDIRFVRRREEPKRSLPVWEIVLLALGSPIWLALLIAGIAFLFSVYVVIWAVIISLWAAEVSFIAGAFGSVVVGVWAFCQGNGLQGIVMLCAAFVLAGLSIFLFFGCMAATKGTVQLTKKIVQWMKALF